MTVGVSNVVVFLVVLHDCLFLLWSCMIACFRFRSIAVVRKIVVL